MIGKAGDTIRFLQYNSGAKIQIMRDADADPRAATRPVELIGTLDSINKAEKMINDVIAEVAFLKQCSALSWMMYNSFGFIVSSLLDICNLITKCIAFSGRCWGFSFSCG